MFGIVYTLNQSYRFFITEHDRQLLRAFAEGYMPHGPVSFEGHFVQEA